MKKYYFILLLVLLNLDVYSVNIIKLDSIPVYEIVNNNFTIILDSFINEEIQYDYYNSNVTFFISILNYNGTTLQLTSGYDYKNKHIRLPESDIDSASGIFYYKTHSFIIKGRSIIDSNILVRTKKSVIIATYEEVDNNNIINDDSFFPTTWIIWFDGINFTIPYKWEMIDNR